jgi:hypothetical protein
MSDADLVKLYSGRILALAADIPLLGRLPARRARRGGGRRFAARPSRRMWWCATVGWPNSPRT